MPVTDEMLLPARCCLKLVDGGITRLEPGDLVAFGIDCQERVVSHPRFFRGIVSSITELELITHYANGCTNHGVSTLMLLRKHQLDEPTECHTQAMVFTEFIASLLGYDFELTEKNEYRIVFRFLAP